MYLSRVYIDASKWDQGTRNITSMMRPGMMIEGARCLPSCKQANGLILIWPTVHLFNYAAIIRPREMQQDGMGGGKMSLRSMKHWRDSDNWLWEPLGLKELTVNTKHRPGGKSMYIMHRPVKVYRLLYSAGVGMYQKCGTYMALWVDATKAVNIDDKLIDICLLSSPVIQ